MILYRPVGGIIMNEEKIVEKRNGELITSTVKFSGMTVKVPKEVSKINRADLGKMGSCMKFILGIGLEGRAKFYDRIIFSEDVLGGMDILNALRIQRTKEDVKTLFSYYERYPEYVKFLMQMRVINAVIVDSFKALNFNNKEFYRYLDSDVIETESLFGVFNVELVRKLKEKNLYDMGLYLFDEIVSKHINFNITALKASKYSVDGKAKHICQDCDNIEKCAKTSAPNWTIKEGKNEYLTSKGMKYYSEIETGVERMNGNTIKCQYICECQGYKPLVIGRKAEEEAFDKINKQEKMMKDRQERIKRLRKEREKIEEERLYSSVTKRGNVIIKVLK